MAATLEPILASISSSSFEDRDHATLNSANIAALTGREGIETDEMWQGSIIHLRQEGASDLYRITGSVALRAAPITQIERLEEGAFGSGSETGQIGVESSNGRPVDSCQVRESLPGKAAPHARPALRSLGVRR